MAMNQPPKVSTLSAAILAALAAMAASGCATTPTTYPPAGPNQRAAGVVANPNCLAFCQYVGAQSSVDSNDGTATGGATNAGNAVPKPQAAAGSGDDGG